jgi:hypothetical protein
MERGGLKPEAMRIAELQAPESLFMDWSIPQLFIRATTHFV